MKEEKLNITKVIYFQRRKHIISYWIKYPVMYQGKFNPVIIKFHLN